MKVGKITGLPVKVLSFRRICIPAEYLKYYGLSAGSEVSAEIGDSWLKISACGDKRCAKIALQKNQVIRLPNGWAQNNRIEAGDSLFLLGVSDGIILYKGPVRKGKAK